MIRRRNRMTMTAVLVTGALALGACTPPLPEPTAVPSGTSSGPVLDAARVDEVAARLGQSLAAADAALDPALLTGVLTGPAATIRTAEYRKARATSPEEALTLLPSALQSQFVPTTQGWPRVAMAATVQPENLEAQRIVVLEQPTARANYELWGWVRLFPGTEVPDFPSAAAGTTEVTDAEGLAQPADEALAAYVDYLNLGKKSSQAGEFTKDELVANVLQRRSTMSKALKAIDGKFTYTFAVADPIETRALRTLDGGAVVVAVLSATEKAKGPKGAKVSPDAEVKGLLGDTKTSNALTVNHTVLVALAIPPEGSSAPVTVLGAENATTSASVP